MTSTTWLTLSTLSMDTSVKLLYIRGSEMRSVTLHFSLPVIVGLLLLSAKVEGFSVQSFAVGLQRNEIHYSISPHSSQNVNNPSVGIMYRHESTTTTTLLEMSAGGKKKKRRRRKPVPGATSTDPVKDSLENTEGINTVIDKDDDDDDDDEVSTIDDKMQIEDVAKFVYKPKTDVATARINEPTQEDKSTDNSIPLPDIKEAKKRKEMEQELERMEEEKEQRVRIKRSDKEAFRKLLEQQPFADADDSYFEEEEYGTVSALLGEKAKPFLGIPFGPLQVGHFIGSLGIILMAFVEYPGFPLTNLPTPLRDALQGGLATVYVINTVLAVFAAFKAGERGQSKALWAAKTFAVGGLAFDQLTQLPTLEQIERAKSRKGARALKNLRKT